MTEEKTPLDQLEQVIAKLDFRARTQCPVCLGMVYGHTDREADAILGLHVKFSHSEIRDNPEIEGLYR